MRHATAAGSATPPVLTTQHTRPSWHNRAGRPDRSACFTLTAAQLWRLIPDDAWRYNSSTTGTAPFSERGCPRHDRKRTVRGRHERTATLTLCAHELWVLHKCECPHPLQGDYRTPKSNAMKPRHPSGVNPNRGVGFSMRRKILGLPAEWETTLTIERIRQHARLSQHFLVCPVCGSPDPTQAAGPAERSPAAQPQRLPRKLPGGRVTKLYLPLCTEQEWEDAQRAHLWLRTYSHPNRPLSPEAAALIERYAELFPGRQLRCRQCLGLRYGEVKSNKAADGIGGLLA